MPSGDFSLLERWRRNRDAQAFKEITTRHAAMVHAACRRVLGNAADAEDVTQECFERLATVPKVPHDNLGAWLHRVATNQALNRLKADKRRKHRAELYAVGKAAHSETKWDDLYEFVDEAIAELPDRFRMPVVAHFVNDQTHAAIAQDLGLSRRAVSHRIAKGVELIAKTLRRRGAYVPAATLAALLGHNLAQAAPIPASLSASLGKLALSQTTAALAPTGALATLGGLLIMKKALIAVLAIAAVWATLLAFDRTGEHDKDGPRPTHAIAEKASLPKLAVSPDENSVADITSPPDADVIASGSAEAERGNVTPVTGTVVDDQGNPVEDAEIRITNHKRANPYRTTRSEEDGSFDFQDFSENEIPLTVYSYGREHRIFSVQARKGSMMSKIQVFMDGQKPSTGLKLQLGPGAVASGKVVDIHGRPVPNIEVRAAHATGAWFGSKYKLDDDTVHAVSDGQGCFELSTLAAGKYKLILRQAFRIFTLGKLDEEKGTEIKVAEGERLTGLVLVYERHHSVAGRVTQKNGRPIEGANVRAEGNLYGGAQTKTDAAGRYVIPDLDDQIFKIHVRHNDYLGATQPRVAADSEGVDFVLSPKHVVSGRVVAAHTNAPITTFKVSFFKTEEELDYLRSSRGKDWEELFESFRDPQGRFEIRPRDTGDMFAVAKADGYELGVQPISLDNRPRLDNVIIRLRPASQLRGTVSNAKGEPVSGAALFTGSVNQRLLDEPAAVLTNAEGRFSMAFAPAGLQVISAYHADYALGSVEVDEATNYTQPVAIVLAAGGTVEGWVDLPDDPGGVVGVTIQYPQKHYLANQQTSVQDDGTYRLTGIIPGEATVRVGITVREPDAHGARTMEQTVTVESGRVTTADFILPDATCAIEGSLTLEDPATVDVLLWLNLATETGDEEHILRLKATDAYRMNHIPAGHGILKVQALGEKGRLIEETSIDIDMRDGQVLQQDFQFGL